MVGELELVRRRSMPPQSFIARTKNGATQIAVPVVDEIKAAIKENMIEVLIIDPFVASHAATENDNNAMELVAKAVGAHS
jgi:AAA domain